MLKVKRVYEGAGDDDGQRILVERLWPRGINKEKLPLDGWNKDVAPSTELRTWFSHDPAKWDGFRARYAKELEGKPEAWQPLVAAGKKGAVTLLFSSHDEEHNNAVALLEFLGSQGARIDGAARKTSSRSVKTSSRSKKTSPRRAKRSSGKRKTSPDSKRRPRSH